MQNGTDEEVVTASYVCITLCKRLRLNLYVCVLLTSSMGTFVFYGQGESCCCKKLLLRVVGCKQRDKSRSNGQRSRRRFDSFYDTQYFFLST